MQGVGVGVGGVRVGGVGGVGGVTGHTEHTNSRNTSVPIQQWTSTRPTAMWETNLATSCEPPLLPSSNLQGPRLRSQGLWQAEAASGPARC